MLDLKPNCESCNRLLPPDSSEARICSYECTFCCTCVDTLLQNVCPNCGGGFTPRPVRPAHEHRTGVSRNHQPASTKVVQTRYSDEEIKVFAAKLKHLDPALR